MYLFSSQDRGVTFWIDEQERTFSGSIGPYSSDNLGAHSLGGFQESFSGLRICRICMATREDTNTKVVVVVCMHFWSLFNVSSVKDYLPAF